MNDVHATERDGVTAAWYVDGGVIRVLSVRSANGTETRHPTHPDLGMCFDLMPRRLWDQIRHEHEMSGRAGVQAWWPRRTGSTTPTL